VLWAGEIPQLNKPNTHTHTHNNNIQDNQMMRVLQRLLIHGRSAGLLAVRARARARGVPACVRVGGLIQSGIHNDVCGGIRCYRYLSTAATSAGSEGPLVSEYKSLVAAGTVVMDDYQLATLGQLDKLAHSIVEYHQKGGSASSGDSRATTTDDGGTRDSSIGGDSSDGGGWSSWFGFGGGRSNTSSSDSPQPRSKAAEINTGLILPGCC
jgi:uncharacterized membrane protein YgcG